MIELSEVEIAGRTSLECVKVVIALALRDGRDGQIAVEVSPRSWENIASELERGGRYYRFEHTNGPQVVIATIALGRAVRIVANPNANDRAFKVA